jgi:hypothetical protein
MTVHDAIGDLLDPTSGIYDPDAARAALHERNKRDREARIREAQARLDVYLEAHAEADAHEEAMELEDGGGDGD